MDFKVRLANEGDVKKIFELSNDPIVRQNSFNSDLIKWEDHIKWFKNKIKDKDCVYFIVEDEAGEFIGQVRFDRLLDVQDEYFIGISISENFRGMGLGSLILKDTSNRLLQDYKARKINAYIRDANSVSIKSFLRTGYKVHKKELINGIKSLRLGYSCLAKL